MIKFLNTEACFLDDFAFNTLNSLFYGACIYNKLLSWTMTNSGTRNQLCMACISCLIRYIRKNLSELYR